jgi:hypothetical protein
MRCDGQGAFQRCNPHRQENRGFCAPHHYVQRFFGFVEATSKEDKELLENLGPTQYETKTRGGHAACMPCTQQ